MFSNLIKLAGVSIEIRGMNRQGFAEFNNFKCQDSPDIIVEYSDKDIYLYKKECPESELKPDEESFIAVSQKLVHKLLMKDVLLFHGVVIEINGQGIIFTAPSGTGKSTHAAIWKKVYKDRVTIINGDKPLIKFSEEGIFACGSPWQGKENTGCNRIVPLKAICIISRSDKNSIEALSFKDAFSTLIKQSFNSKVSEEKLKRLELIGKMDKLEYYALSCNMGEEAAITAYEGIFG